MRRVDIIPLHTEVRNHLINTIIELVLSLVVVVHDLIGWGLGVDDHQGSVDAEVEFGLGEAGVFGDVFGLVVLLFVDYVDLGLVGDFGFLGGFLDTQDVLV